MPAALVLLLATSVQAPVARWTPELAFSVKRVGSVAMSPDGRWAEVEVSEPLMEPEPSEWRTSVYLYAVGGVVQQAARRVETPASAPAWSPDGRWLAFASSRSGKRDVWRVALDGSPAERLTDVTGELGEFRWSPDGRRMAFVLTDSAVPARDARVVGEAQRFARLYLVDVATGRTRPLVATPAAEGGPAWSPDGRSIAVTVSDAPATYALTFRVVLVSPVNGAVHPLAESFDRRPAIVGWTGDARAVVISEARGTVSRLSALPADGGAAVDLSPDTLMVSAPALNGPGTHVGFVSEAPDRAPEPYVSRLAPFAPTRVAALQSLPAIPFGRTEPIRWRSFDGREIEGLVTYPAGYRPGAPVPLLTILHGGPPSSFTRTFTGGVGAYPLAAFASAGFAVLRPNVRGSSGYGREFRYANLRDWGGGDFRDAMAGIDT